MKTVYHHYTDPGHGWLKVENSELVQLRIDHLISDYSYRRGKYVFLEEDRDAELFVEAKAKKQLVTVQYRHHYADKRSRIRSYERYAPMYKDRSAATIGEPQ